LPPGFFDRIQTPVTLNRQLRDSFCLPEPADAVRPDIVHQTPARLL